ncbi:MAG TPA: Tol-Pal system beta propeller repeat protein TolB [Gammaproteobacteria bacterium]|nr:Tol-Pal system beta propeller repeat protein TolB [Gammaproteobacteria bacterium]
MKSINLQSVFRTLFLAWLVFAASAAHAVLTIEITQGVKGALPIAIVPFGWSGQSGAPEDIAKIVGADLARSGYFAPLPQADLPARPHDAAAVRFPDWRMVRTDNLVIGKLELLGPDSYQVKFHLFDVYKGKSLAGYSFRTNRKGLRRVAHQISDIIYQKLTGRKGVFSTSIAYVTAIRKAGKNSFALSVADADGYNEQVILDAPQPLMSPAWSPDGKRLAYVSFETGRSAIYVQNVETAKRTRVASFKGINSAPAWSPDGRKLAFTSSKNGNADIYVLDLGSRKLTRITSSRAIDTEAAWSPDGGSIVFTSDRGGSPQIYQIAVGSSGPTGKARRVTYEGNYNARASFSADGSKLVMVHRSGGRFQIAVMELKGGQMTIVADTLLGESPSFAPNGDMVLYATEVGNKGVLEAASVDSRTHQRLGFARGDVREPAWSPLP